MVAFRGTPEKEPTMATEYSLICSNRNHGQSHRYRKPSEQKALQAVLDSNHEAEVRPNTYYAKHCAPWRAESRNVESWTPIISDARDDTEVSQ